MNSLKAIKNLVFNDMPVYCWFTNTQKNLHNEKLNGSTILIELSEVFRN